MSQEKWDRRFLALAKEVSTWSKDPSTKCGAVIVNLDKQVVGMGYNGFPRMVRDSPELYEDREVKYGMVVHAELNAILHAGHAARNGTIYVYPSFALPPLCNECAKAVIQAGIRFVVGFKPSAEAAERAVRWKDKLDIARDMIKQARIDWRSWEEI